MGKELTYTTGDRKPNVINIDDERFEVWPVPGMLFKEFLELAMQPDPPAEDIEARKAKEMAEVTMLFGIFRDCMEPDEYARFDAFCHTPRGPDLSMLVQILQDVVEASADFPTSPPSPLSPGPSTPGTGSTGGAFLPASTWPDSPSGDS